MCKISKLLHSNNFFSEMHVRHDVRCIWKSVCVSATCYSINCACVQIRLHIWMWTIEIMLNASKLNEFFSTNFIHYSKFSMQKFHYLIDIWLLLIALIIQNNRMLNYTFIVCANNPIVAIEAGFHAKLDSRALSVVMAAPLYDAMFHVCHIAVCSQIECNTANQCCQFN